MINGHLSEAQQGFAVLDDVDEATFVAFIRWTYSKDYPAREHTIDQNLEKATTAAPATGDDWDAWGTFSKKDKKKKGKKTTEPAVKGFLRESFVSQQRNTDQSPYAVTPARANKGPEENYSEVFMGHASMYVFAEKYDIQPLKKLALQKLQHQLAIHTLYVERAGEILTLLKYVYANTAESADEADDIRTMLAHYVGVEMNNLQKDGEIKDFMQEEGDFLSDFLKMFALRIN